MSERFQDDRTAEQRATHTVLVSMEDRVLSGWGGAKGGKSIASWACRPEHLAAVENWVRSRKDAKRVTISLASRTRPRSGTAHWHIYVVGDGHPALAPLVEPVANG